MYEVYSVLPQGTPFTTVEPDHDINDMCYVTGTGLLYLAAEDSKLLSYYIPVSTVCV